MAGKTKVSEIDATYLASYLRIESPTTAQTDELETMLASAIGYLVSYTGLSKTQPQKEVVDANGDPVLDGNGDPTYEDDLDAEWLDTRPEFMIAVCVLVQNQYDNRTFYTDKGKVEEVVSSILGMHRVNLL